MGFLKRLRERRRAAGTPVKYLNENGRWVDAPVKEGFFSPKRWKERVANRREFRVKVSGNRKWILIGVAVVAVCGTIIYLSVTYGGGIVGFLK